MLITYWLIFPIPFTNICVCISPGGPDFNYLMTLPMWSLTKEKKEALLKERDQKSDELYRLKKKTSQDLWRDDLDGFLKELDVREIIIEHSYF